MPIAIPHAWLIGDALEVIDPTWTGKQFNDCAYYGVAFAKEFVREFAGETEQYGILENDYLKGNRLKREGFPDGALLDLRVERQQ